MRDVEYTLVDSSDVTELIAKVNRLIDEGWRPQGGIAVAWFDVAGDLTAWHYQAMIRDV